MKIKYRKIISIWFISLIVLFPVAFALSINPDSLSVAAFDTSAEINWTTDSLADGKVKFGQSVEPVEQLKTIPETGGFKIKHSVQLLGLEQGTKYFYKVASSDGSFSSELQTFEQFTTMVSSPKGLNAKKISHNEIEITWEKNTKASKYKIYLNNTAIGETASLGFIIKTLNPETDYEITVTSIDNQNKESKLSNSLFNDSNTINVKTIKKPLEISFVQAVEITKNSAKITWKTNEEANSTVIYGKTKSLSNSESNLETNSNINLKTDLTSVKIHTIVLENLNENSVYFYKVKSENRESDIFQFKTLSNESLVIDEITVSDISKSSAIIKWKTNIDSSGEVVYSIDDLFSQSVKDAVFGKEHQAQLTLLLSGITYFYKVKSGDIVSEIKSFTTNESLGSFLTIIEPVINSAIGSATSSSINTAIITNQMRINISGKSKPGAKLFVFVNDEKTAQIIKTLPETSQGEFKVEIKLNQNAMNYGTSGNNIVKIQSWDKSGRKDSIELQIIVDVIKPALQVNQFTKYTSNSNLNITGITEANATVEIFINNVSKNTADVNESGYFVKVIGLSLNNQTIKVQAKDLAGNINFIEQNVTLDKKNPTITFETQFASETHFKFLTVTGTTEPFAKVYITNYGEFDGCNDIEFTNRIGKCSTFVSEKYLLPSTIVSSNIDPLGILFGSTQELTTGEDGKFTVRVPMFESLFKNTGINKLQFLAVDDAGNVQEITKNIRYNPGCNDWVINFGEIKAYPFNVYTRELTSQSMQGSAFIPIQYVGLGTPKIGNIRVIKDDQSVRESIIQNTGEVISQEDGNKYVTINNFKASQYDQSTGKAYLYVPITFNKYTGKIDDLKDQINVYLKATISYDVDGIAEKNNLKAPLQSGFTQSGSGSCEVFPLLSYSIQKPLDYSLWLTPEMINKSIAVLDKTISATEKLVDISKKAALYTTLACGAMVVYNYLSTSISGKNSAPVPGNEQCTEADLGLEKVYYICDRILCPIAPPRCDKFTAVGSYKIDGENTDEEKFNKQTLTNKPYYEKYDQLKSKGLPLKDIYKSRDQFIQEYANDQTVFGQLASSEKADKFKPVQGPEYFTTQIDKKQGYTVQYYPLENGNLKDMQSIRTNAAGTDLTITVQVANQLQQEARRCSPDAKTLIMYTKYEQDKSLIKTTSKETTYLNSYECSIKSSAELGTPKEGEFKGCYNEECPQFDDAKCFGQEHINPVGGLWSSAKCACLPGIKGHLQNLLRIMQGAKKCLQQAQIGEVRGGYCERLLAQFVCDLFTELILKSLFGTSSGDSGLLGGLFGENDLKDYKSKSNSISDRLGDRYGDILKSRFGLSSDQLVNKFCIFGITLDWSVLEDVLNQVVESIDIAPMIHLEADSRAYGYDPFTGKMNIGYNIYLGVVPGGPTELNMWLECDRNIPGGELCGTAVPKYIEIPGYRRHMEKQDIYDENIPFVVQNSQWWYNKAVLEVTYRIGDKSERRVYEKTITRKGELAFGCSFSIIEGIKCDSLQFLEEQGGIIELYKPGAANGGTLLTPRIDTYYLGNNVNALVRLKNEFKKDYFFIRVDYSDQRQSIEYPIPVNQAGYGNEQTYLIWLDSIGGNSLAAQTNKYNVDSNWGGFNLEKQTDDNNQSENLFSMSLKNNYKAIAAIVAEAYVDGKKVEVDNIDCKLSNINYKNNTLEHGETICIMENDKFKISQKSIEVKASDIIRIKSISFDLIQETGTTTLAVEKIERPNVIIKSGTKSLILPFIENKQPNQNNQNTQAVSQLIKSVTINVYQDTNQDGKGDTPISYDNTIEKQEQQAIQLQYQTAANSANNIKPMIEFIEPISNMLNNDGNIVPLGFSILDDKNDIKTLKINILGRQRTSYNCEIEFTYQPKMRLLTESSNNPKDKCQIKIASNRNIDNNKLNFYAFELDAAKLAKGVDDIYDITAVVSDGETDSVSVQKQSLRFDQIKGENQLKANQLLVCLGSYDCYQWKEAESASNIVPLNQVAVDSKMVKTG